VGGWGRREGREGGWLGGWVGAQRYLCWLCGHQSSWVWTCRSHHMVEYCRDGSWLVVGQGGGTTAGGQAANHSPQQPRQHAGGLLHDLSQAEQCMLGVRAHLADKWLSYECCRCCWCLAGDISLKDAAAHLLWLMLKVRGGSRGGSREQTTFYYGGNNSAPRAKEFDDTQTDSCQCAAAGLPCNVLSFLGASLAKRSGGAAQL
jgi:hypothetical protein